MAVTPIPFADLETAVENWLMQSTGLDSDRVQNFYERDPQPPIPYINFKVPVPRQSAGPDEARKLYRPGNPIGGEVETRFRGQRELIVSVEAFSIATTKFNTDQSSSAFLPARTYIEMAMSGLALPSISEMMYNLGLVFVDIEAVADFSVPLGPIGQGRAQMDVRFRTVHTNIDTTGYIINVIFKRGTVVLSPPLGVSTILSGRVP